MLTEIDVHGVVLGHSERRQYFNETDKALSHKLPAALSAGLKPILCVGETEDERERGDTERKLRHQVQEGLERLTAEQIARGHDRLRADLGDRHRQGRDARAGAGGDRASSARSSATRRPAAAAVVRVLYGGSVDADNAAELLALPDVDGALVGGASLDAESFARIVTPRRPRSSVTDGLPSVCLVVLDGWGLAPDGPGQRRLARRHAGLRRALGALPAHDADGLRRRPSACPTARWATPRSAISTSARARSSSRT